ncbi:glycerophosphodiester phosphodiesterase family protein [Paenibacillus sp. UNC451MF]|uniref:glycerophosphodiester phosphodiesterase family protein n=1 Tax=Paenibacillus sp. UNC451MF TaxID=1449063 RepID=UPI000AEB0E25|nr:glycerophosphodiester phosphodiesterase family protein [Paenibacillus sp. UNC451MF]
MTQDKFAEVYSLFNDPSARTLTVSHRGDWRHYPENSLAAVQSCINMGIDMVEIDVRRTRDGHLVLMHDKTVDRMTNGSGKVSDLTLEQIQKLFLYDGKGGGEAQLTSRKIATLEEIMLLVKGKMMINLDKCWDVREEVYDVLVKTDTLSQGLFKSSSDYEEVEDFLNNKLVRPEYMHVIEEFNVDQLGKVLSVVKPKALELVYPTEASPVISVANFKQLNGKHRIWVNAIQKKLCGGYEDTPSGWDWMVRYGFNMIQTDWPLELKQYLEQTSINVNTN